jgi:hypothetical protein
MPPSPHHVPWPSVVQIIPTRVDFVLDFLYIWLVAFIWYVIFINLLCDFVLDSIWNLDLVWFVAGYETKKTEKKLG